MKRTSWIVLLGVVVAMGLAGCSKSESKEKGGSGGKPGSGAKADANPADSSGPLEVCVRMRKAQNDGDGAAYAACFKADADCKAYLAKNCQSVKVSQDYEDAMIKAYGPDAVDAKQRERNEKARDPKWFENVRIEVNGDVATFTPTTGEERFPFIVVKEGGKWLIPAPGYPPKEEYAKCIHYADDSIKVDQAAMAKIGKPGYSAYRIKDEAAKAMSEATRWMK